MPSPESASAPALCAAGPSPRLWQAPVQFSAAEGRTLGGGLPGRGRGEHTERSRWPGLVWRLCLSASLAVALAAGLSGCAPGQLPTPSPAPAAAAPAGLLSPTLSAPSPTAPALALSQPVRLVLWHAWLGDRSERALQEAAGRFHQQYPLITVDPVCVGEESDLAVKTVAAIGAGHPPDLTVVYQGQVPQLMRLDAAVPLEPYLNDAEVGLAKGASDDFFPGCWQAGVRPEFGNRVLTFPFARSALAMYYNKSLLKRANLNGPPKTWADLEAACKAISRGDVVGLAWHEDASTFGAFLYSRGAKHLTDDLTKAVFNGPEGVESLDLLVRLGHIGAALRTEGEDADRALFAQGKVAFTFASTRDIAAYAEAIKKAGAGLEWGVTMIPQADGSRPPRTAMVGADLCILKTGEVRQRAAWQFVRWFTDSQQVADWASGTGYMPTRKSAVERLATSGYLDQNPPVREACTAVIPYAYPEPDVGGVEEIRKAIESAWAAAAAETKTSNQALDAAVARANEVLAAKK